MKRQRDSNDASTDRDDDSEFKIFKKIEDTIEGSFDFVVRFVRTSITLALNPKTVLASISQSGATVFSRPYTYLAFSVFLSGVMLRGIMREALFFLGDSTASLATITEELGTVTLTSMLQTILPTLSIVLIIGAIFGWRIRRRFGRPEGLQIVCYTAGFQFILIAAASLGNIGFEYVNAVSGALESLFNILVSLVFLYIWAGPAYVLFTFTEACKTEQKHIPKRTAVHKISGLGNMLLMSFILLYAGSSASLLPLFLTQEKAGFTDRFRDGKLSVTLTIENTGANTTILTRTGAKTTVRLWQFSDEVFKSWDFESDELRLLVKSWDGGESPVLVLEQAATRWIQVTADLGEAAGSKAKSTSAVYAELDIFLATTSWPPFSDTFYVGKINITED